MTTGGSLILDGTPQEGERLANAARTVGLTLKLVGGVAIWVRCPGARVPPLARDYGDADFVGRSSERKAITDFMTGQGYQPDAMFNALHGATRLNYHDPARGRPVDVLLDRFVMAHELNLRTSLGSDELTLSLADLLLTKLQVVDLNRKDLQDILALLLDHGFEDSDISMARILDVTRKDWGFEHTIHRTLATTRDRIGEFSLPAASEALILARVAELETALSAAPKTTAWKLRARIGERVRWYQEPEEARA
jgi:hypothetical protein